MRKILFLLFVFVHIAMYAQYKEIETVRQFGENLHMWCASKNDNYRTNIESGCPQDFRVKDYIMESHAQKTGLKNIREYVLEEYLNIFETAMSKGALSVDISNVRVVSSDEYLYSYNTSVKNRMKSKDYTTVACDIKVNGVLSYDIQDLFYLRKNKILKVTPYKEEVDKNTGKRKVLVDFSDLSSDETIGVSYSYNKSFPVGFSFNYSFDGVPFMLSADIGVNLDGDKYVIDKVEMTDIVNYNREKKILDPQFYLTVTPQLYIKYFAIGCGVGFLCMSGDKEIAKYNSTGEKDGVEISSGVNTSESTFMFKPMIRPVAKFFIPLRDDELFLSVSAGYDYIFGYKDVNGFNFGIGMQWEL